MATLLLGALYLASQRDLKRLLAYSSIEHMGILAIGVSFASPLAIAGVLLHVLAHAAAKGTAFFGAGSVVRKLRTKDMERIRGGIGLAALERADARGRHVRPVGPAPVRHVPLRVRHRGRGLWRLVHTAPSRPLPQCWSSW